MVPSPCSCGRGLDALTAARMLARGAAPIHLTVTGATAARYAPLCASASASSLTISEGSASSPMPG